MNKTNSQNETPNYGLHLPSEDDFYDVNITNDNITKIDQAIKQEGEAAKRYTDDAVKNVNIEVIDSVTSTDKTKAGSANAVKMAYDKAAAGQQFKLTGNDGKVKPTTAFTSFDDIKEPGFYYAGGTITAGKPTGFNSGLFIVNRLTEAPGISQMLVNYLDNKMWIRYFNGTSWSAWTEQETTAGAQAKATAAQSAVQAYVDSDFRKPSDLITANLVKNSTGMLGLNNWTVITGGNNWIASRNQTAGAFIHHDVAIAAGSYSVLRSDPIGVSPNATYFLQALFHTSGNTSNKPYIEVRDKNNDNKLIATLFADQNKWWHRKTISILTPSGCDALVLELVVGGTSATPASTKGFGRIKLNEAPSPDAGPIKNVDMPYTNESDLDALFQSVSDGKGKLETTIIGKGGTVSKVGSVPTFDELNNGINLIKQPTGSQDYTTKGTYTFTVPSSVSVLKVLVVGGGGGGAGGRTSGSDTNSGGGGGGGGINITSLSVTPGQQIPVIVGGGGNGGGSTAYGSGTGNPGGSSSFGSITASGGGAGLSETSGGTAYATGGAGGSGGGLGIKGSAGGNGITSSSYWNNYGLMGGAGGASFANYGTGGTGGSSYPSSGSNGSPGRVLVFW